jgi:hypothetical protein
MSAGEKVDGTVAPAGDGVFKEHFYGILYKKEKMSEADVKALEEASLESVSGELSKENAALTALSKVELCPALKYVPTDMDLKIQPVELEEPLLISLDGSQPEGVKLEDVMGIIQL